MLDNWAATMACMVRTALSHPRTYGLFFQITSACCLCACSLFKCSRGDTPAKSYRWKAVDHLPTRAHEDTSGLRLCSLATAPVYGPFRNTIAPALLSV
ncbi:hypothetical protein BOTBODRAFT_539679 [Botryobasidium botryosum FD-172 SS1]|uniref:Uncharacterized protein n=1 Tax=Botryobasidium botryosum (strain FD-172 SS1) TaxID=930990 RepID=A0A067M093_BOTB1|nr:hypothetical protein BOTBODRAFT_539679 [Botryobasidium botryosum FD-172 SS1]